MKKIYTSILMLAVAGMMQAMTMSVDGIGFINNDTTITVTEANEDPISGELVMGVKGNIVANGELTVVINRYTTGIEDQLCVGSACNPGNQEATQTMVFNLTGMSNWYTHYAPKHSGTYTIEYCFTAESQTIRLTVNYTYLFSSLNEVKSQPARQGVYSIFGQQLREDNSIDNLPAGIYIVGGKKVVIK